MSRPLNVRLLAWTLNELDARRASSSLVVCVRRLVTCLRDTHARHPRPRISQVAPSCPGQRRHLGIGPSFPREAGLAAPSSEPSRRRVRIPVRMSGRKNQSQRENASRLLASSVTVRKCKPEKRATRTMRRRIQTAVGASCSLVRNQSVRRVELRTSEIMMNQRERSAQIEFIGSTFCC